MTCTRSKQGIHRHQTPPQYRNVASHASPYGPLQPNLTSSIKPEVHNVTQRRQRRTEPQRRGSAYKILWRSIQRFQRYARGQTDKHTDRLTDRHTSWSQYSTPLPRVGVTNYLTIFYRINITSYINCSTRTSLRLPTQTMETRLCLTNKSRL